MDPLPATTTMHQESRNRNGTSPALCTVTRHLRRAASAPATPTAQEASGPGTQLLHGRRVRRVAFPCATPRRGNARLGRGRDACFEREANSHAPSAWMDRSNDRVGHKINFNRHFYKYTPPRSLELIDAELKEAEDEILRLLREVTK